MEMINSLCVFFLPVRPRPRADRVLTVCWLYADQRLCDHDKLICLNPKEEDVVARARPVPYTKPPTDHDASWLRWLVRWLVRTYDAPPWGCIASYARVSKRNRLDGRLVLVGRRQVAR